MENTVNPQELQLLARPIGQSDGGAMGECLTRIHPLKKHAEPHLVVCPHHTCIGKSFSNKYKLRRHLEEIHEGLAKRRCHAHGCTHTTRLENLRGHCWTIHLHETNWVCRLEQCAQVFKSIWDIFCHLLNTHYLCALPYPPDPEPIFYAACLPLGQLSTVPCLILGCAHEGISIEALKSHTVFQHYQQPYHNEDRKDIRFRSFIYEVVDKRDPLRGFCTICHTKSGKWKGSSLVEHLDTHKLSEVLRDSNQLKTSKKNKYVKDDLLNYLDRKTVKAVESSEAFEANGAPAFPGLADSSEAFEANGAPTFPGVVDSPSGSRFPNLVEQVDSNFGRSSAVAAGPTTGLGMDPSYMNELPDVDFPSSAMGELPLSFTDLLEGDLYAPDVQCEVEEGAEYGYCPICQSNYRGWVEDCLGTHLQTFHISEELQLYKEDILGHAWNQKFRNELEATFFPSFQEFLLE